MPKPTNKPQMAPISRVLDKKVGGEDEILYPTPTPFLWQDKTYKIKPLTNKTLKGLTSQFDAIIALFSSAAASVNEGRDPELPPLEITPAALLPHLPKVLDILLPNATVIIADSLRLDEELIEEEMFWGTRLEALKLIIEANDFPLLFANFKSLTGMFTPPQATPPEMNTDPEADEDDETDD